MVRLQNNQRGFSAVEAILLLVILGLVGFVGWYVYDSGQKTSEDTKSSTSTVDKSKEVAETSEKVTKSKAASSDEQVIATVKAWCSANVDPATKKPFVLTVGKAGEAQKQVLYSADKNFAYVNAVCTTNGTTEGSGSAYYLKKVNDTWVYLYRGQMASPEYTEQFGIPSDFN